MLSRHTSKKTRVFEIYPNRAGWLINSLPDMQSLGEWNSDAPKLSHAEIGDSNHGNARKGPNFTTLALFAIGQSP
jgi:hypothetical protein